MKNNDLVQIGANIKAMRTEKGYIQKAFALAVKLDVSYFGGVERGDRNLSALNLIKISRALREPVSELFKGVKYETKES